MPGHSGDLCWRPTHSLTPKRRWEPTGVWAAPADGSSHTGTGSWFNAQLRNWRSRSPSCLARRPPQAPPAPEQRAGASRGSGSALQGAFRGGCDAGAEMGRQPRVPVRSIAPSSPPHRPLIAPSSRPHRPSSPPVQDGAAEAGRPRGAPRGLLRSPGPLLEPSLSPGAGRGRLLPAVGFPEQRHSIWFTCCTTAYKD